MNKFFKAQNFIMDFSNRTYIMGILNATPDSFSDGNTYLEPQKAFEHAQKMQKYGADIIDIGGQSTRPGYIRIGENEELARIAPILKLLNGNINLPISIDTFYPKVAEQAIKMGANIINDVSGIANEDMFKIAYEYECGIIIMSPVNLKDTKDFLNEKIKKALNFGIKKDYICQDPGIGFNKTYNENLLILQNLNKFINKEFSVLIGASRKRVIGFSCQEDIPQNRDCGTIAAHTIAQMQGANILRVHDVKKAKQAALVADAIIYA